jgi:hypothetical protein
MTTLLLILIVVQLLLVVGACWWRKYQADTIRRFQAIDQLSVDFERLQAIHRVRDIRHHAIRDLFDAERGYGSAFGEVIEGKAVEVRRGE